MPSTTRPDTSRRPRVLIVGAGFAGLATIRGLRHTPVDVTVIDRTNHHLFQPLVYQVATGLLSPGEIAPALRKVLRRQRNTTVRLAETTDMDLAGRQIELLETGGTITRIGYDYLVVAAGSHDSYFGHDDWAEYLYPMKTLAEAVRLRGQLLTAYERADQCGDPAERSRWKTFVIVGAGPTGVEIAGQLASLARELQHELHHIDTSRSRIVLIDALPEVLSTFPQTLRSHTHQQLTAMGIEIVLDARADAVDGGGITVRTKDGHTERIDTHTVIWAAGVKASPLAATLGQAAGVGLDHKGRVPVRQDCSLSGYPEVFVIGDIANLDDLPGLSEPALQEGRYVAKVLHHKVTGESAPPAVQLSGPGHHGHHLADGCHRGYLRAETSRPDRQTRLGDRAHRIPRRVGQPGGGTRPVGIPARQPNPPGTDDPDRRPQEHTAVADAGYLTAGWVGAR